MIISLRKFLLKIKSVVVSKKYFIHKALFVLSILALSSFLIYFNIKSGESMCKDGAFSALVKNRVVNEFEIVNTGPTQDVKKITLIISTSSPDHALGLSNIPCIPPQKGMIFEFAQPDYYGFWMKDTLVNLDIAWLDESYNVVFLLSDVATSTYPNVLKPEPPYKPATYVVEMKAGEMERLSIEAGTKLTPLAPQE